MQVNIKERMWAGVKAISPILLGVIPFAMIVGVFAVDAGLTQLEGIGMTAIVYAGASQLAAIQMLVERSALPVLILTVWVINLRFLLYSASLGEHFKDLSLGWKLLFSYLITDQGFAVSVVEFEENKEKPGKRYFYLGASLIMWLVFFLATGVGVLVGASVPASWNLDFAFPLSFMGLVVPTLKDRPAILAGLIAGTLTTLAVGIPYNLGLPISVLAGIGFGMLLEKLEQK